MESVPETDLSLLLAPAINFSTDFNLNYIFVIPLTDIEK